MRSVGWSYLRVANWGRIRASVLVELICGFTKFWFDLILRWVGGSGRCCWVESSFNLVQFSSVCWMAVNQWSKSILGFFLFLSMSENLLGLGLWSKSQLGYLFHQWVVFVSVCVSWRGRIVLVCLWNCFAGLLLFWWFDFRLDWRAGIRFTLPRRVGEWRVHFIYLLFFSCMCWMTGNC